MPAKTEKRLKKRHNNKLSWYSVISNHFLNISFVVCTVIICIKNIYINNIIYRVYTCASSQATVRSPYRPLLTDQRVLCDYNVHLLCTLSTDVIEKINLELPLFEGAVIRNSRQIKSNNLNTVFFLYFSTLVFHF